VNRKISRIAVTALLALGILPVAAGNASAACPVSTLCLYQNTGYGGGKYITEFDNNTYHNGDTFGNGYHLYDAVSSYENSFSSRCWFLFSGHYYSGSSWTVYPSERVRSMIGFNDVASSHFWDVASACD
jgi:hypothetical protein